MLGISRSQRGDTLIEVLFAVSVFSLVAVSALTIMNQGTAISQRALETTLVRQEMSAQAETLRFLHDSYIAAYQPGQTYDGTPPTTPAEEWQAMLQKIENNPITTASDFDVQDACPTAPSHSFIMDSRNARFVDLPSKMTAAETFAQLTYTTSAGVQVLDQAQGIWIEAIRSATNTGDSNYQLHIGYIDFHIRACWIGPGQTMPIILGTIVRLYEPR